VPQKRRKERGKSISYSIVKVFLSAAIRSRSRRRARGVRGEGEPHLPNTAYGSTCVGAYAAGLPDDNKIVTEYLINFSLLCHIGEQAGRRGRVKVKEKHAKKLRIFFRTRDRPSALP
jgi:hypothetical protein